MAIPLRLYQSRLQSDITSYLCINQSYLQIQVSDLESLVPSWGYPQPRRAFFQENFILLQTTNHELCWDLVWLFRFIHPVSNVRKSAQIISQHLFFKSNWFDNRVANGFNVQDYTSWTGSRDENATHLKNSPTLLNGVIRTIAEESLEVKYELKAGDCLFSFDGL